MPSAPSAVGLSSAEKTKTKTKTDKVRTSNNYGSRWRLQNHRVDFQVEFRVSLLNFLLDEIVHYLT